MRFLALCKHISVWSDDPSRKVGAVIVDQENQIIATGYNGFPTGIASRHERFDREIKYFWVEHAERVAIYNAARIGARLLGCRIYSSLLPCADCSRAIIQSGLTSLITYKKPTDESRYQESMVVSLELLLEAQIKVKLLTAPTD